jgi:hypothetical protein
LSSEFTRVSNPRNGVIAVYWPEVGPVACPATSEREAVEDRKWTRLQPASRAIIGAMSACATS